MLREKIILQMFADGESGSAEGIAAQTEGDGEKAGEGSENTENGNNPEKKAEAESPEVKTEEKAEKPQFLSDIELLKTVRAAFEEDEKAKRIDEVIKSWEKDEIEIKKIYPSFRLENEIKNEDFASLLKAGVPLKRAYEAANLDKILTSAMKYAYEQGGKKTAQTILKCRERPQENGVLDRASSVKRTDVGSLTEKDIMKILGEVSRGAKISFD